MNEFKSTGLGGGEGGEGGWGIESMCSQKDGGVQCIPKRRESKMISSNGWGRLGRTEETAPCRRGRERCRSWRVREAV